MSVIRILIAEDYKLLREFWTIMLSADSRFNVIASCEGGEEAIALATSLRPDIVLMDIHLPRISGIEATESITRYCPEVKVIGVTALANTKHAKQMLQAGAKGYITKNSSVSELVQAIMQVHDGKKYICTEIKDGICEEMFEPVSEISTDVLTARELEIINLLKNGLSSKQIADVLGLSLKTVEVHRHNMLKKTKLPNAAALIQFVHNQNNKVPQRS